ncbi:AP-3 complex subunit mu [Iris pallida]|uniref:AP-3 complex subunit mu n=1 Tax=Iris pallida TaxID=29817 RepID=A0AAX6I3D1_IRIPA|nr:AP-3 complex subunit mu [Iris pallida]
MSYRAKKLKKEPSYVKPQLASDAGTCHINVLVGIWKDPGKPIDNIMVQFQLPSCGFDRVKLKLWNRECPC